MRLHSEAHRNCCATLNETTLLFDEDGNSSVDVNPEDVANFLLAFPQAYWLVDDDGNSLRDDAPAEGDPSDGAEAAPPRKHKGGRSPKVKAPEPDAEPQEQVTD